MDLPTLDFSQFLYGSEEKRFELAVALVDSFKSHGFVKLVNHGIREETVRDYLSGVWLENPYETVQASTNGMLPLGETTFQPTIGSKETDRERQRPASAARMEYCWCRTDRASEQGQLGRKRF